MLSVFRFLRGYVRVYLYGFSPERFINLCNHHRIELWDVMPCQEGYEFYIHTRDFFGCKDFLRKTKTKVVIRNKLGLPFLLFRYRKRKLFFVGFTGCFLLLFLSTRFIWAFELDGNRRLTEDMYLDFLKEQQVDYGMAIHRFDIDEFEKSLRNKYDFITWASAKMEGTKLHVTVKENEIPESKEEVLLESCDLRATTDGIIIQMITRSGVPAVKQGQEVKKGDLLVSGVIPVYNDDTTIKSYSCVRADADVLIESVLSYEDSVCTDYEKKVYTENKDRVLVLGFGQNEWMFGKTKLTGEYEIMAVRKSFRLFDNWYLPFTYGHNEYVEYEIHTSTYTKEETGTILNQRFSQFCESLEEKGVQIIEKNVKIDYIGNQVKMSGVLVVRSDGCKAEPITDFPSIEIPKEQNIE